MLITRLQCLVFIVAILITTAVSADVWTNVAGHSIEAKLIGCTNNQLEFLRADGKKFVMPLKGLSKESRKQARKLFPEKIKPTPKAKVKQRIKRRREAIKRHANIAL